jgi:periplasmic divalent cation tolerance protein
MDAPMNDRADMRPMGIPSNPGTEPAFGMAIISAPVQDAHRVAQAIVQEKLAACAQVSGSVESIYWWRGTVHEEPERLIFLKTAQGLLPKIRLLLSRIHPYEVPELVFLPFTWVSEDYLYWLAENLSVHDEA